MSDSFSIRMSGDDGLAPPAEIFATRPDEKGPKTVAILLIAGAMLMIFVGFGDLQNANSNDLSQEDLDTLLTNVRNQGDNITDEQYQQFHDDIRESGAYSIRGWSLMIGGIVVGLAGVLLFKLNLQGPKMAMCGAGIGFIGGTYGSWTIKTLSESALPEAMVLANEILTYVCGVCMVLCLALAGLPLMNASAKAALNQKIVFIAEQE
jgi:uncharacterized membrane protein